MSLRSFAYALARFLGDVRAVRTGRILPRLFNKLVGRQLWRVWR